MTNKNKYGGVIVPMASPLTKELEIDVRAVNKIINTFIDSGVKPFILGTTGEASSVSSNQKNALVQAAVSSSKNKEVVLAGIIGNSLFESIEEGNRYADYGVDAVVATVPNYYPSDGAQMQKYLAKIADSVSCPVILYNTPGTNHRSIPLEVIDALSHHPNIVGVKDSERNKERLDLSLKLWKDRDDFVFLIGWAAMSVYGLLNGADGIVPSTANFVPEWYHHLFEAVNKGEIERAKLFQEKTNNASELYQTGRDLSRSIPALKQIMAVKGLCNEYVLPPMYEMESVEKELFIRNISTELEKINDR